MRDKKPVAITGLGLMTALGIDLESSWKGLIAGENPVKYFTLFDPAGLPVKFGAELPKESEEIFKKFIKPRNREQMTRSTMIAVSTAIMALQNSGLDLLPVDKKRVGVVVGATGTGYAPFPYPDKPDEYRILKNMANSASSWISLKLKIEGPSFVVSTACSSGIYALFCGYTLIKSGICDVVIAGAAESCINYLDVQGFSSLMALSEDEENFKTASRPFDRKRNGFVIGEGGGMMVLESPEFAKSRNAKILSHLYLPAITSEGYNILAPLPEGKGMAETMKLALKNANLQPKDIDYINAHGTSTQANDLYETLAIKEVFGECAKSIPVSSTKSMTGHCLSGAAGVEAVICCKAIIEECIPPTINLSDPDPQCNLDYVPNKARKAKLKNVMCNSFAFGGHNGVAIFSKVEDE